MRHLPSLRRSIAGAGLVLAASSASLAAPAGGRSGAGIVQAPAPSGGLRLGPASPFRSGHLGRPSGSHGDSRFGGPHGGFGPFVGNGRFGLDGGRYHRRGRDGDFGTPFAFGAPYGYGGYGYGYGFSGFDGTEIARNPHSGRPIVLGVRPSPVAAPLVVVVNGAGRSSRRQPWSQGSAASSAPRIISVDVPPG